MQMRYNATRKVERQENAVMSSKVTKEKWESDDISSQYAQKRNGIKFNTFALN